ncbi:MAG: 1-(5-phosphoribosyl)-5-[(5-phosphoribosylamino)methylideneamino]imidazole-4-carboxamide isomerase [Methanomassiliicoccales archaeon]|nr:MAG: 1-(5-phosphoribosyl)-5-[(5-phosphoribosylamino)methylideneamino]imidazole-4-carboxamide isomerase [Methanomassiliicoccales archaeon]
MIVMPAIDILGGKVVQLVGGVPGTEQIKLPDPLTSAKGWEERGAPMLHVIDLDAALGRGNNVQIMRRIVERCNVPVQVGGGVRSTEVVQYLLDCGAARVIVGTRAIKDRSWLSSISTSNPGKVVLALDVKGGNVQVKGWQEAAPYSLEHMFGAIADLPLAGVLYTNVDVEGRCKGIDAKAVRSFVERCPHKVIASGGVSSQEDIDELEALGVSEAVVGLAIYTGKLNPDKQWRKN